MLVYAGMEGDNAAERSAKLKALKEHYNESDPTALEMLAATALGKSNTSRGTKLVINSHGNVDTFADLSAKAFYDKLVGKGFQNGAFQSLYLIACDVGQQDQKNTIVSNFARDLNLLLKQNQVDIALYAPRGVVTYAAKTVTQSGQSFYQVTGIAVHTPERDYPLDEGMLKVMF
jgi:hypothetical protein